MDWSPLVGVPFRDCGRSLDGCDCYGLFREVYRRGLGIDLPGHDGDYVGRSDREQIARLVASDKATWQPIVPGAERPFDAVLMVIARTQHLGVVVGQGLMLHMPRDSYSVIEPYSRYAAPIGRGGFFRFRG